MKPETKNDLEEWLQPGIDPAIKEIAGKFLIESKAAVDLASKCEFHPLLHSVANLNTLRRAFLIELGLDPELYSPGKKAESYSIDSAFDETLDDIVDSLRNCSVR